MMATKPLSIDPEAIKEQRTKGWPDWHPEDYCHRCGQRNIKPWYVDSALWNQAAEVHEILCPQCFVEAYEAATGEAPIWRLAPSEQSDEKSALIKSEAAIRNELNRVREQIKAEIAGEFKYIWADYPKALDLLAKAEAERDAAVERAEKAETQASDLFDEAARLKTELQRAAADAQT